MKPGGAGQRGKEGETTTHTFAALSSTENHTRQQSPTAPEMGRLQNKATSPAQKVPRDKPKLCVSRKSRILLTCVQRTTTKSKGLRDTPTAFLPDAKRKNNLPRVPFQVFHVEGLVGPGNQDLQFGLAEHLQPLRVDDFPQTSNERLRLRLRNKTRKWPRARRARSSLNLVRASSRRGFTPMVEEKKKKKTWSLCGLAGNRVRRRKRH